MNERSRNVDVEDERQVLVTPQFTNLINVMLRESLSSSDQFNTNFTTY